MPVGSPTIPAADRTTLRATLQAIQAALQHFQTIPCNLAHEKVTSVTAHPSYENDLPGTTHAFSRAGFCVADNRQWILNCAHSMAAAHYKQQLQLLKNTGLFTEENLPLVPLNQILASIYTLDHAIGDIEKQLAWERYAGSDPNKWQALETQRKQILKEHRDLIASLQTLHQQLLQQLRLTLATL